MAKQLKIMFVPFDSVGHVNACIGFGERLRDRGHKIVFAVSKVWKEILSEYGFVVEIIEDPNAEQFENPGEQGANQLIESGLLSGISSLEKIKIMSNFNGMNEEVNDVINKEPLLKAIIDRQNPDLFILDHFFGCPSVIYADKPWIFLFSGNVLYVIDDERTPPACSGYSVNGDQSEWQAFKQISDKRFNSPKEIFNKWLTDNGYPKIKSKLCIPHSPYLNIYGYPEELDYTDVRPLPPKWIRIDAFMREGEGELKIPEYFLNDENNNESEKLIYLSLGSMGSIDVELMKRLVAILAKSPHKFIVSKGPFHEKYELADNMWGQRSVPQTKVLPLVDLVITHGGNNTVTETFSFGKPMIVMPLFADQFDNAQRIDEKGFGIRLDGYNCTESELLNAIEKLLNDEKLKVKLIAASNRITNSDSYIKAIQLIENMLK